MKNFSHIRTALFALLLVACSPFDNQDKIATYLTVSPSKIAFKADGENSFTVDTDGDWLVTAISDKVTLSDKSGTAGKTTVKILSMTATTPQVIVIRTPSNTNLIATVEIKLDDGSNSGSSGSDDTLPTPGITLYHDNVDGNPSYTDWANNSNVWQNPIGEGSVNVTY